MGWLKIQKLEYLENGHNFFTKQKNSLPVTQMTHFEKLIVLLAEVTFKAGVSKGSILGPIFSLVYTLRGLIFVWI